MNSSVSILVLVWRTNDSNHDGTILRSYLYWYKQKSIYFSAWQIAENPSRNASVNKPTGTPQYIAKWEIFLPVLQKIAVRPLWRASPSFSRIVRSCQIVQKIHKFRHFFSKMFRQKDCTLLAGRLRTPSFGQNPLKEDKKVSRAGWLCRIAAQTDPSMMRYRTKSEKVVRTSNSARKASSGITFEEWQEIDQNIICTQNLCHTTVVVSKELQM